jgi:hypothetical protein
MLDFLVILYFGFGKIQTKTSHVSAKFLQNFFITNAMEVVIVFGLVLMNATMAGFFGLIFRRFRRPRRTSSLGKLVLDTILPADATENNDNPLNLFF